MAFAALTAYDVPIVSGQKPTRYAALEWARQEGGYWPGSRIIQHTKRGPRTIWRAPQEPAS